MNLGTKIKDRRKQLGITQRALSKLISMDNSQLSKIEQGKLQPTINKILELSSILEMSLDDLLRKDRNNLNEPNVIYKLKTDPNRNNQGIPLYNLEASTSLVSLFGNQSKEPKDYLQIPNLPKCDGALTVTGDSMYPLLKSGDLIIYRKVELEISNILFGEMYLIAIDLSGDEYVSVKWIHPSDKGDEYIKLVSENKHHQPKDVSLKKVLALALVKASVRINAMK